MIRRLDRLARGREVYLAEVTRAGSWPDQLPPAPFVALTVLDAANHTDDQIRALGARLLDGGCIATVSWGQGNRRMHELLDESRARHRGEGGREDFLTWFSDDDPLDDALWEAINLGDPERADTPAVLLLVEPPWLEPVLAAMRDPDAFCTALEEADGPAREPKYKYPDRTRPAPRRRRWPLVVGATVAATALAAVAYLHMPAVGHPSGATLNYTLAMHVGSPGPYGACTRVSDATWRCEIRDPEQSGTVGYELTTRGRRCWTASRTPGSEE